jgi:nucleotide-binding universal stress UspA family protein
MTDQALPRRMNILLAIDGSPHSMAAAQLICDLPLTRESSITTIAVLVPRDASSHASLEAALSQIQECFSERGIKVNSQLLTGYPAEQISDFADQLHPDLIVLGAKGQRATLGILLGGVVQHIVEYSYHPVLVVRAPYDPIQRIVLVTDGSQYSMNAVNFLGNFPLPAGVDIRVMHVLPPLPSPILMARSWTVGTEIMAPVPSAETEKLLDQQAEEEERNGKILLEDAQHTLKEFGISASTVLLRGDAATEILEYLKTHQINLVIAGSRGLSQMKRLLLGSLSRKLVHYAGCSVLVVKREEDENK